MDLLGFAREPGLIIAFLVFFIGIAWRLYGVFRLPTPVDLSEPRSTATGHGAWQAIMARMWPRTGVNRTLMVTANAYLYHIGLALIAFAFAPHILFLDRLTGVAWPPLPDAVTIVATPVAIVTLVIALLDRLGNPVTRLLSNFDDYFTWAVTLAPVITGMAVIEGRYAGAAFERGATNDVFLAIHLLSFELMLIWFPFGKLMHAVLAFVTRGVTGATLSRKGAEL